MRSSLRLLLGLGALLVGACRDLEVPPPGAGAPPDVRFTSPADGAAVTATHAVSIAATDANGVASVVLRCGNITLFSWAAAPYQATVDFRACRATSTPASGMLEVPLRVVATDVNGLASEASISVQVDLTAPVLQLTVPARTPPRRPLQIDIASDQPLQGLPVATAAGTFLVVEPKAGEPPDAPLRFTARLAETPGLGTDGWGSDAGAPPLEVLEELERPLTVTVEALGRNGNTAAAVVGRTLLTRIAWERALPGSVPRGFADGMEGLNTDTRIPRPVAFREGLIVPLERRAGGWIPGFFHSSDGTFTALPLQEILDGFRGRGVDRHGRVLLTNDLLEARYYDFVSRTSTAHPAVLSALNHTADIPFAAVEDRLCEAAPDPGTAGCGAVDFVCVTPDGGTSARRYTAPDVQFESAGGIASGGNVLYPALGVACCGTGACVPPQHLIADADGGVTALPQFVPLSRTLPLGNGAFAVAYDRGQPLDSFHWFQPNATAEIAYPTVSPFSVPDVVVGRETNEILELRQHGPGTAVLAHVPDGGSANLLAEYPVAFPPQLEHSEAPPPNAVATPSGLAFLVEPTPLSKALVALSSELRPRWIYRYPQVCDGAYVIGSAQSELLYFIDLTQQRVVALYP